MSSRFSGRLILPTRLGVNTWGHDSAARNDVSGIDDESKALIQAVNQSFAPALLTELNMHGVRTQMLDHAIQSIDPLRFITQNVAELDILFPDLVVGNTAAHLLDVAIKLKAVNLLAPAMEQGLSFIGLETLDLSEYITNHMVYKRAFGDAWGKLCQFWLDIDHELVSDDVLTVGSSIDSSAGESILIKAYPKANGKEFTVEYDFSPLD